MKQTEVEDFCKYEVYEIIDNQIHTICLCSESKMADLICRTFATLDPNNDAYFYTNVVVPHTFVPGGGWYICYHKNAEGFLEKTELS